MEVRVTGRQYCVVLTDKRTYFVNNKQTIEISPNVLVAVFKKNNGRYEHVRSSLLNIDINNGTQDVYSVPGTTVSLSACGSITENTTLLQELHKNAIRFFTAFQERFGKLALICHPAIKQTLWSTDTYQVPSHLFTAFKYWEDITPDTETFVQSDKIVLWKYKKPWFYDNIFTAFKHCVIESLLLHGYLKENQRSDQCHISKINQVDYSQTELLSLAIIALQRYAGPYPEREEKVDALDLRHLMMYTNTDCEDMAKTSLSFMVALRRRPHNPFHPLLPVVSQQGYSHTMSQDAHDVVIKVAKKTREIISEFTHPCLVYGFGDPSIAKPTAQQQTRSQKNPRTFSDWCKTGNGHVWGIVKYFGKTYHLEATTPVRPQMGTDSIGTSIKSLVSERYQPCGLMDSTKLIALDFAAYSVHLKNGFQVRGSLNYKDFQLPVEPSLKFTQETFREMYNTFNILEGNTPSK